MLRRLILISLLYLLQFIFRNLSKIESSILMEKSAM